MRSQATIDRRGRPWVQGDLLARIRAVFALLGVFALSAAVLSPVEASTTTSVPGELTFAGLVGRDRDEAVLVDNGAFLPADDAGPAQHTVEARLTVGLLPNTHDTQEAHAAGCRDQRVPRVRGTAIRQPRTAPRSAEGARDASASPPRPVPTTTSG